MLGYEESDRQRGVKVFLMDGARSIIVGDDPDNWCLSDNGVTGD